MDRESVQPLLRSWIRCGNKIKILHSTTFVSKVGLLCVVIYYVLGFLLKPTNEGTCIHGSGTAFDVKYSGSHSSFSSKDYFIEEIYRKGLKNGKEKHFLDGLLWKCDFNPKVGAQIWLLIWFTVLYCLTSFLKQIPRLFTPFAMFVINVIGCIVHFMVHVLQDKL